MKKKYVSGDDEMRLSQSEATYWSLPPEAVLSTLSTTRTGLKESEATTRLGQYGENSLNQKKLSLPFSLFLSQFKNPIMIILMVATIISGLTGDALDALIIMTIILASVILSFIQEYTASNAVERLRSTIQLYSTVLRDGVPVKVATRLLVPGDMVLLSAGCMIPGDGLILDCDDLFVNESALTGESFPVEKIITKVPSDSSLTDRVNCVFAGTNVTSGSGRMLLVHTGIETEIGKIADELTTRPPENEFERGIRHFGYFLTKIMLILTVAVFLINIITKRPVIEALLFSVALAVGITPQLLPAIINITLARGSRSMSKEGVIVRHLTTIENFGSMDVLCTDKTGTLTEGNVQLDLYLDADGKPSEEVFRLAYLNARLQNGMENTLDQAIIDHHTPDISTVIKMDEIPFDFTRKRLSLITQEDHQYTMITKGALNQIISICQHIMIDGEVHPLGAKEKGQIEQRYVDWSSSGYRVLGIANKKVPENNHYTVQDEASMIFIGFLLFQDPPKKDAADTIKELNQLGVELRIITGDNKLVALHTSDAIGLIVVSTLTGAEIKTLSDEELEDRIESVNLFAEVDPSQKERIILALKKKNHVVGYMGDGINDAPALHAADVSISVNTAVDVAKEAADFVLLDKSLTVLKLGIELGRISFGNTLKYIYITTSANFGNMFSMAGASLFMPFLPLLPKQILLINFLTDFPALTLSGDTMDPDMVQKPHRMDIRFIRNFMLTFGLISSIFDYLAIGILLMGFRVQAEVFQSGWFILSVLTELMVLLVMRTQRPFFRSRPAPLLLISSVLIALLTLILPYTPISSFLSITPIDPYILLSLLGISVLYILTTEIAKGIFYRRNSHL